jgi:hypothetical protein
VFAVLTGDIIRYKKLSSSLWLNELTLFFNSVTENINQYSIYRGDEFQILVEPQNAVNIAIQIKGLLQNLTHEKLNARIAIGIGTIDNLNEIKSLNQLITHSRGKALERSGELLDNLKNNADLTLQINSGNPQKDAVYNLLLRSLGLITDNWTQLMAETAFSVLKNQNLSNKELAEKLKIAESTLSSRKKRANLDLVKDILSYFEVDLKQ